MAVACAIAVGICGGSGSGKSAVAAALCAALGERALLLHQDHYYRDRGHLSPAAAAAYNFDQPAAVDLAMLAENLAALRAGRAVREPRYDFTTHARAALWTTLTPRPVVVVEGLLLFADPAVRAQIDLKVYLDVPADLRLARRLERDLRERGMEPTATLRQYLESVRPMHLRWVEPLRAYADLTLPETPIEEQVRALLARLNSQFG